jgi:hypothetical protein
MSEFHFEIKKAEATLENIEEAIKRRDALNRLCKNPDFELIINDEYLREESVRLTYSKGSPNMQGEANQKAIIRDIDGIGCLYQYLHNIHMVGNNAEESQESERENLEFLRSQESQEV